MLSCGMQMVIDGHTSIGSTCSVGNGFTTDAYMVHVLAILYACQTTLADYLLRYQYYFLPAYVECDRRRTALKNSKPGCLSPDTYRSSLAAAATRYTVYLFLEV